MIKIVNLHKKYNDLEVLKGVDLEISKNEIVSIVGASGAGKTTLLQIIGTLETPSFGEVYIADNAIHKMKDKALSLFRNKHIGFVFQFHHLLPEFTALENICIPAYIAKKSKKEAEKEAMELLEILNLANRATHKPSELSGGEQQRVAVARALINKPDIILADEPSGNLDSNSAAELHKLFFTLRDVFKHTFVIVTHNNELANMSDRKITIKDGSILN